MSRSFGYVELDRAVDSIRIGHRHRQDMGDIAGLAASIQQRGMLQPITITPDGVLLCGARRLAATKRLGWRTVNVWVRSGVSTMLERLLAEQDENMMRKPLAPTEAAALYQELKAIMTEDAARRSQATRFGTRGARHTSPSPSSDGAATVAAPSGDTRALAAQAITGRNSYTTLERISEIQRIAIDPTQPGSVRDRAAEAIKDMDADGNVTRHFATVRATAATAALDRLAIDPDQPPHVRVRATQQARRLRSTPAGTRPADLIKLTREALARARTPLPAASPAPAPRRYGVRAFRLFLHDMRYWTRHYDPGDVGRGLTDEQWADFEAVIADSVAFAELARRARVAPVRALGTEGAPAE